MAGYVEDPFQMDDDFTEEKSDNMLLEQDIAPRYDPNEVDLDMVYKDSRLLRSRIDQLKLQEGMSSTTTNNTTEEDEEGITYEEDIDDKLDPNMHQKSVTMNYDVKELTPPENFAPVVNTIYRSSFPQAQNFPFIQKLKLKSILCLIPEEYPDINQQFLVENNIKLFQLGMSGNKEPFVKISSELITEAIKIVINPANHPILIHCNRGKHRTGCLVGVLRRLQRWSLTMIFDEYRKFSAPKERPMDQQFIELYDVQEVINYAVENNFFPIKWG